MSQFKIKGIDYTDDSLQHASFVRTTGRTNPYGSMKIGSKEYREKYNAGAFQDEHGVWYGKGSRALNQRDGKKRQRQQEAAARQNLNSKIPTIVARDRRPLSQRKPVNLSQRTVTTTTTTTSQSSNPAAATARGKDAVAKLMGVAVDPRGQAQPLEGFPKRKLQDAQGQTIIEKDARQQNTTQNENLLDRAGRAVTDAANAAGQWVSNAANDVGRAVTDAANSAGQWIGNAANDVGNFVGNTAQNVGRAVTDAANSAGQWVGNAANDVGRAVSNVVNQPRQETPQQKSLWDTIGGWFAQAGQDIANTAVGAWDTVSGAASDAAKWVGDRLNEAGDWAQTAMNDVGQWVGDRAAEFDTWLNGRQVVVTDRNGPNLTSHYERQGGALNDVGNALNAVGQGIGNVANDVGRWVGNAANDVGRTARNVTDDVLGRYQVVDTDENGNLVYGNQRVGGLIDQGVRAAGRGINDLSQQVQTGWNDFTRGAQDTWNRGVQAAGRGINDLGQQVQTGWNDFTRGAQDAWNRGVQGARNVADDVLGRYQVVDTDENGNLVYGNQRVGGLINNGLRDGRRILNDAGQWIGDAAGDASRAVDYWWNGTPYSHIDPETGITTPGNPNDDYRTVGAGNRIINAIGDAGRGINNLGQQIQTGWNDFTRGAQDTWNRWAQGARNVADDVLGRYQVVDTDENGNLVYGNQRQGGLLNQGLRAVDNLANQGIDWINNDIVAPVGTAVDNVLNGTPATNRYYDTQTGQWVEPGDRVGGVVPWIRDRATDATNLARNAYNTAEGAVVDAADAVRDTAVNAYNAGRDAYNNYQDDQNIRNLARQSSAYQNAPEETRQQVEQSYSDRYRSARNNQAYQAAVSAGVPTAQLNSLINDFAQGSIDNFTFNNELARLGNLYANVYNQ